VGSVAVVLVAAGSGTRLGATVPKAFALLSGESLLDRAVAAAGQCPDVSTVVVVAPPSHLDEAAASAAVPCAGVEVVVVPGGMHRGDSVGAGLAALLALADQPSVVLVHDAARALAPASLFTAVIDAVRGGHPAVVPGLPVVDTIKQVDGEGRVVATPDRSSLRAIQTPQGFTAKLLRRAHESAAPGDPITDDAALVERMGIAVHVIDGDPRALKITTPEDLVLAEALLERNRP
jgi:2-C-methyl-D-erythritol 4-phosphate cytidylyltransferase